MKTYEIRECTRTGKIIGTVQANTPAGAKQKWRAELRNSGNDKFGASYWHVHVVVEVEA